MPEALAAELRAIRRGGRFGVPARAREWAMLVGRFASAGLFNTGLSLAVIMALEAGLRADPQAANAAGYAVGIASGFLLSRGWVFRSRRSRGSGPRYVLAVGAGFLLNQVALLAARRLLAGWPLDHLLPQLCGMASYTASVFLACRFWVFREPVDPVVATA